jgi:hypothetical protein
MRPSRISLSLAQRQQHQHLSIQPKSNITVSYKTTTTPPSFIMDKIADKAQGMADKTLGKDKSSQPGNGVERAADNFANNQTDSIGDKAGVPDKYNDTIHKGVDSKINDQIPGGN